MLFRITARQHGGVARRYYSGERLVEGYPVSTWGTLDIPFGRPLAWADAKKLFEGRNPDTGEQLIRRRKGVHKSGWDATFVAPKTVSILWGIGGDKLKDLIEEAHRYAVVEALNTFIPKSVFIRDNHGDLCVGGYIFDHGMTRMRDPHLHTHFFLLNMGYAGDTQKFRALTVNYRWASVAKDLYLVSLAWGLVSRGIPVVKIGNEFEIPGLRPLKKLFSSAGEVFSQKKMTTEDWKKFKQDKDLSKSFQRLSNLWKTKAIVSGFDVDQFLKNLSSPNSTPGSISGGSVDIWKVRHVSRIWSQIARMSIGKTHLSEVKTIAENLEKEYMSKVWPLVVAKSENIEPTIERSGD